MLCCQLVGGRILMNSGESAPFLLASLDSAVCVLEKWGADLKQGFPRHAYFAEVYPGPRVVQVLTRHFM